MIIAIEQEPAGAYLGRMATLIASTSCHAYLDTSFLMWLAKLSNEARLEFTGWAADKLPDRLHVPLWCAHEFFKHCVDGSIAADFEKELKRFDSDASSFYGFARAFVSDDLFGGQAGAGSYFVEEYVHAVQRLRGMLALALDHSREKIKGGIASTCAFIDARSLDSPLELFLQDIEKEERARNRGRLPPCFQDAHKRGGRAADAGGEDGKKHAGGDNSFGDLVIWKEILHHAKNAPASDILIFTRDRKNDWFVKHQGTAEPDLKARSPQIGPVPRPHPWLRHEATKAAATNVELIDPPYLSYILETQAPELVALRRVGFDNGLPQIMKPAKTASFRWWRNFRDPAPAAQHGGSAGPRLEEVATRAGTDGCSAAAIPTIEALSSGNPADRTAALAGIEWDELAVWSVRDRAVLGRILFDLSEAGDPNAKTKLDDLVAAVGLLPATTSAPIGYGILSRLYFDDDGDRRRVSASDTEQAALRLVSEAPMGAALEAIGKRLADAAEKPLFVPGTHAIPLALRVVTTSAADGRGPADLSSIQYDGHELITDAQPEVALRFSTTLGAAPSLLGRIIEQVTRRLLLPNALIKPDSSYDQPVNFGALMGVEVD